MNRHQGVRWFGFVAALFCASAQADTKDKPAESKSAEKTAAYVGGVAITLQELDEQILKSDMKLAQQFYDARRAALDDIIIERALAKDAEAKGVPIKAFIEQSIAAKAKPVTDADVEAFFNANQARMGGKTLDQMSTQIKTYLESQGQTAARAALLEEIRSKTEIRVTLDPPRADVKVAANDPVKGPEGAKVTIIEFSEFQ